MPAFEGISRGPAVPPVVPDTKFLSNQVFRFQHSSGSAVNDQIINSNDLLTMISVCSASAATSTMVALFQAVRLRKVEMWLAYDASISGSADISLAWDGVGGPTSRIGSVGASYDRPAHIVAVPPPDSRIRQWKITGTNEGLFSLTSKTGTIIDVTVDLMIQNFSETSTLTTKSTGVFSTVGQLYNLWLDFNQVYYRPLGRNIP